MNFVNPVFLYVLPLVAVPLIIHLFNFQRSSEVKFTNVAFLQTVKEMSNAQDRLKKILVMIARMAFILLAILTFARPYIPKEDGSTLLKGDTGKISIYIDNSFSMQSERNGKTLLDAGKDIGRNIPGIFPVGYNYQIIDNRFTGSSRYFKNQDRTEEEIIGLTYSNFTRGLDEINTFSQDAFVREKMGDNKQIFMISDFQKSTNLEFEQFEFDTSTTYHLIPLQADKTENLRIDSVWLEKPFLKEKENNKLFVKVSNLGKGEVKDRDLKLYIEDVQSSNATISLEEEETKTIEMAFAIGNSGAKRCRVSIDDYPVDFDNDHYFILNVSPNINIAIISDNPRKYLSTVYKSEPFLNATSFRSNSINYSATSGADLLILDYVESINESLNEVITNAIRNGTNIAVFPPPNMDIDSYSSAFGVLISKNNISASSQYIGTIPPPKKDPFFANVFEKRIKNMSMPEGISNYQWNGRGVHTLLGYKNGQSFLTVQENALQNIYFSSVPLDPQYSNFGKHALFVPIMYRMAILSKTQSDQLSYNFGEKNIRIRLEGLQKGSMYKLQKEQLEIIPTQKVNADILTLKLPNEDMEAGCYAIKNTENEAIIGYIAFNYDILESKLESYSTEELKDKFQNFKNVKVYSNSKADTFKQIFMEDNVAQPLWRFFLLFALLFLSIEMIILRFWK
ncbi:BatA domain-containing protein [Flammeovirga sp. EKP202]|uniref:BatA domain-containing protein n=1 Tax=Flammeovirga sp. EKP202 TaxID=2770592 RepID=UPI00165F9CF0|nr:BatA domain-containing protein [Flammeovirga sp. EKP202]MBD0399861.1 BatA domain-containing protein [Flammeovirga sp. EKP202]